MRNILKIIKISRSLYHLVAVLALLILAGAFFELVVPILSKFIVDEIVAKLKGTGGDLNRLIFLIALTFGLSVLGIILSALSERLGDHFGGRLRKFLTEKFYNKVLTLPQSYFDSEVSGKIVNQLNRGITTIQDFINTATNFILPIFLQTILTIIILAHYNMPVAFFTFLLFPVYLAISYYSAKKWGVEEVRKNKIEDSTRGRIQEVIGNMKLVKSFTAEEKEYDIVSQNLTDINEIYARQSQAFHFYDFLRNFSLVMVLTIVNIIVFINAFQGRMTLGEMVLILQLINQARRPLFAMSFILEQVQRADSGSQEFFELISLPSVEQYRAPKKVPRLNQPTIEFRRVSFKYDRSVE
ncbi:ABC transporter ATP-binding protein [Candidatus Roizmanbacteria bacterium]|nr:ABC transporter ATP-binding protein [Candidatus Roizmanbacteria bacterium]